MNTGTPVPQLGTALREEFERRIEMLGEAARRVRRHTDDEAIHDMRVAARRLEAAFDVWRGGLRRGPATHARRTLRKARRRLGAPREHEVHVALLERLLRDAPVTTRLAAAPVRDRLRRARDRGRRRAADRAAPSRLTRRLRDLAERGHWLAPVPEGLVIETARVRVRVRAGGARTAFEAAARGTDRELHTARIEVKKWRYAAECLAAVEDRLHGKAAGAAPGGALVRALRDVQKVLGDVHDMATLRDVLGRETARLVRRGLSENGNALVPLVERIEERRLEAVARFRDAVAALEEREGARRPPRVVPMRSATPRRDR